MGHFAKLGANGKVLQVLTMDNEEMKDADGNEVEAKGQEWLERHNNWPSQMWIQTSYNTSRNTHSSGDNTKAFRGNYAGIGMTWDEDNQIFWDKKPYPSWVKDTTTASWKSPIGDAPNLTAEKQSQNEAGTHNWHYVWNEDNQTWDLTDSMA
jgi:hypothetical protein|tara:strand:- start:341 stop:796 length:456 start_codon:yes stop_codon:yes gene_type:complete